MPIIAYTEPASLIAGDTAKWIKALPDYPASVGWALSYELVNAGQRIAFGSAPYGDDHLVNVPAATTAPWAPGAYSYRARAALAGEVFTVGAGPITVAPAFAASTDARSQARRTLEAIDAVIEGRASSAVAEYSIAGRSLKNIPVAELLTLRDRYARMVRDEEAAAAIASGRGNPGRVYVRFGP